MQFSFSVVLPFLRLRMVNNSVVAMNSEQGNSVSHDDLKPLINASMDQGEFYRERLIDYITKMKANTRISEAGKKARLDAAQKELDALNAAKKAEFEKPGGTRDEVRDLQRRIDRGDFDSTSGIPDRDRGSVTTASAAKTSKVGGGGYTKSDSTRDSYRGRYNRGGLATMFVEKR